MLKIATRTVKHIQAHQIGQQAKIISIISKPSNTLRHSVIATAALLTAAIPSFASPNLLSNGSFESGSTGWTSRSGIVETSNVSASYAIAGAAVGSFFCEVEGNTLSPTTLQDWIEQSVATASGETYFTSIQGETRNNAVSNPSVDMIILYANGTSSASQNTTRTGYTTFRQSFVASGASSIIRYVSNGSTGASGAFRPGDGGGLMVDDAQVQELTISTPSATKVEDVSLTFSNTTSNAFQVATNTGAASLTVVMSVTSGTINLSSLIGLTITSGANNAATFTFTGTAAAINTALGAGVAYTSPLDFNGSAALTYTVTAGAVSDTDTTAITITPVADIVADSLTTNQSTAIAYNAIAGTNGASADNFENTPSLTAVSTPIHGTATFTGAGVITYTPVPGYFGTDTFTYTVTSGGVTEAAIETITIVGANPSVTLTKTSTSDVGTFTFTGSNGWTSQNITTLTSGIGVIGPTQTLTSSGITTTLTESIAPGFVLTSASCTDSNSANTGNTGSFGTLSGTTLTVPASKLVIGAKLGCSFNNTKANPKLSILKSKSTAGPVAVGAVVTYTYVITNIGNVPMAAVNINDTHNGTGVFSGPTSEILLTDNAPLGDSTDSANNGTWDTIGVGDVVNFTATYTVTQNDVDYLQ